jgi:hypothetical protein
MSPRQISRLLILPERRSVTAAVSSNNSVPAIFKIPIHHLAFVVWIIKQFFSLVQWFFETFSFL